MKFDVIVGNPPYQLSDSGHGTSAKPIYHLFVQQAKKLNPRFLTMIIPARWYAGGKGLDAFRQEMLADNHIRRLVDYGNSQDVFNGVDIAGGICYFLWDRDGTGECQVDSISEGGISTSVRQLDEFDIFVRDNRAVDIIRKVQEWNSTGKYLSERVSSRKPFGLPTNYQPKRSGIPCWFIQKLGRRFASPNDVSDPFNLLQKWKLLAPPTPIAGQTDFSKPVGFFFDGNTRIAKPGECCTESYIVLGAFDSEMEVISFKTYIFTKTVRYLLLQTVVSQHVTKKNYRFIPDLERYENTYTDDLLQKLWGISDEERAVIESRICNMGGASND